ncbi:MAG: hypothetical protein ACK5RL_20580 [Acidimicrobiales bacterium]
MAGTLPPEEIAAFDQLHKHLATRDVPDDPTDSVPPSEIWDRYLGPAVTPEQRADRAAWCARLGERIDPFSA